MVLKIKEKNRKGGIIEIVRKGGIIEIVRKGGIKEIARISWIKEKDIISKKGVKINKIYLFWIECFLAIFLLMIIVDFKAAHLSIFVYTCGFLVVNILVTLFKNIWLGKSN